MTRLVLLLLVLVGCSTPVTAEAVVTPQAGAEGVIAAPSAVRIPALGVESSLIPLGLDLDGALSVPPLDQPMQAGWYEPGVIPGEPGPAVIAAHVSGRVDGQPVPGLFARLAELNVGDEVIVERFDAAPLLWRVTRLEIHDKDRFPTAAVYGDTDGPELRLVTCGGRFDPAARSYESNVIVFAVPA